MPQQGGGCRPPATSPMALVGARNGLSFLLEESARLLNQGRLRGKGPGDAKTSRLHDGMEPCLFIRSSKNSCHLLLQASGMCKLGQEQGPGEQGAQEM